MRRTKKTVIAISIVLGVAVYFYVMIVCLMHDSPNEKGTTSQKQQAKAPRQEEITLPREPESTPKPSRPVSRVLPPRSRSSIPQQAQSTLIGSQAPDFTLPDLDGRQVKLSYFKGKLIILDFWATWCGPCVKEIPHFIDLYEQYADRGLVVLGVSVDRKGTDVVNFFVRRHKVNYQILMADAQVRVAYGGIRSIPTTFVIDREGKIRRSYVGYRDKAVFEADIKALLVTDESLLADLESEEPSEQLDAMENLIARGTFPESEVFLKFCNDIADPASQEVAMVARVHKVVVQYLSHTQLSEEDMDCLKDLPSPHGLEFDRLPITDAGMSYLERLSSLRSLSLRYTKITDTGLAHLQDLTSLHTLRLEGTRITGQGLIYLKNLSSLKILYIGGTQVTDAALLHIENLTELERFCVHHTQVTVAGLSHLKNLRKLKYLCLHDTQVDDSGLEYLQELTALETLLLHNTWVTDEGLIYLEGLNSLKRLTLSGTPVTCKGINKLKQAMPSCDISGPLPAK